MRGSVGPIPEFDDTMHITKFKTLSFNQAPKKRGARRFTKMGTPTLGQALASPNLKQFVNFSDATRAA
jgi:hypothetical protein